MGYKKLTNELFEAALEAVVKKSKAQSFTPITVIGWGDVKTLEGIENCSYLLSKSLLDIKIEICTNSLIIDTDSPFVTIPDIFEKRELVFLNCETLRDNYLYNYKLI